jgi:hypothetical protein
VKFDLPYANLTQAQKNTLKAALASAKGRDDQTLSLTIGATTYTNLGLDSDEWSATESETTRYAGPVSLSQQIGQNRGRPPWTGLAVLCICGHSRLRRGDGAPS